jgi:hypothetical protein
MKTAKSKKPWHSKSCGFGECAAFIRADLGSVQAEYLTAKSGQPRP